MNFLVSGGVVIIGTSVIRQPEVTAILVLHGFAKKVGKNYV